MKKYLIAALCFTTSLCTLTSCYDDDELQGMALSGCWDGDFGMCYDYKYNGRYYTEYADATDIQFYPYNNSYDEGYGYQVDYYRHGPWDEVYHSFTWEIRNGIIYLDYCKSGEEDLTTYLRDYEMTDHYLAGYFGNTSTRFKLYKYESYINWSSYYNVYGDYRSGAGYGYHDYYDWDDDYYARTRSGESDAQQADADDAEAPQLIRSYSRYNKK